MYTLYVSSVRTALGERYCLLLGFVVDVHVDWLKCYCSEVDVFHSILLKFITLRSNYIEMLNYN